MIEPPPQGNAFDWIWKKWMSGLWDYLKTRESYQVNVKDFGATGVTGDDDTAAIQAAIDYVEGQGGGVVYIPAGTYDCSDTLTIPSYVVLKGEVGKGVTKIVATSTQGNVIENDAENTNPSTQHIGINDLHIQGNSNTDVGLFLEGCQYSHFKNVYITGVTKTTGYGVELTTYDTGSADVGASMNDFTGFRVHNCYNGWKLTKHATDAGTDGANLNQFYSCNTTGYGSGSASSLTGIGVYVEFGEGNTFTGCRNLTGNDWTTAWQIEDSVNTFMGCASDGAIGGSAPSGENSWGMPYGYGNNARGFYFTATATGSIVINPLGNSPYERVSFADQGTFETIFILRHQFNWLGASRLSQIGLGNDFDTSVYHGSGTPEGSVTAKIGSTYHREDGGAGTSFYVKESGTDNTGWVAK